MPTHAMLMNTNTSERDHIFIEFSKYHTGEIFVVEAHPNDPRLLLSAGHDGNVILWNILTGRLIKRFYNRVLCLELTTHLIDHTCFSTGTFKIFPYR
jgi:WD40 repeat protein